MIQPTRQLVERLGYSFKDEGLLTHALTHRSAASVNNERLEFLGDAVLGQVVAHALFARFPEAAEGELSRLRAALVRKETLASVARALDLGDYLELGPGELRTGGHTRSSILADALEAIFGAVFLDGGQQAAEQLILMLFEKRIDELTPGSGRKDPKTRLQEFLQGQRFSLPDYEVVDISGADHDQLFSCRCSVSDLGLEAVGEGRSRRRAEQAAAAEVLRQVGDGRS